MSKTGEFMARPKLKRRVCCDPGRLIFGVKGQKNSDRLILNVDQFETIRLLDYENKTQEEAAKIIGVARTTVQRLYHEARKTLARSIIEKKDIIIEGGHYEIVSDENAQCGRLKMEDTRLRIVVVKNQEAISEHFGQSDCYLIVSIENGKVLRKDKILADANNKKGFHALLISLEIDALIVGGMGEKPFKKFSDLGIEIYQAQGSIDEAIEAFIKGELKTLQPHHHHEDHSHQPHKKCCNQHAS